MFKKLLAAIGVGGASVDTRLLNASLQPGQTFEARIVLKGGEVSQSIAGLELALMTRVKVSDGDSSHFINHCLASWRISEGFELQAGEERELPFIGQLHPETPFTELPVRNNQCRVWLQTGLAIDYAIDPGDQDLLQIQLPSCCCTCCRPWRSWALSLKKPMSSKVYQHLWVSQWFRLLSRVGVCTRRAWDPPFA